jgi:hypothetical protein
LRDRIKARLCPIGVDETVWVEQLTCLLNVADHRNWERQVGPLFGNAKARTADWPKEVAETCWAFDQGESGDFEALAKEITSLTVEACGIVHDGHPGLIHAQNAILKQLTTFGQATEALNKSEKMNIQGVSLYSFIPESDDSSSRSGEQ